MNVTKKALVRADTFILLGFLSLFFVDISPLFFDSHD